MTPLLLVLLGLVATVVTAIVLRGAMTNRVDPTTGLVGAVSAAVVWGVFAFGALNVDIATNGEVVTRTYQPLALLGGIGGAIALFVSYKAAIEVFRT